MISKLLRRLTSKPSSLVVLCAGILVFACGQDYNSNSGDKPVEVKQSAAGICESEAGARFCAARLIYQKNCFSCHPSWAELADEQSWIAAGLVKPGSIDSSPAINRLINYGSNMPLNGSALSATDYESLTTWVELLQQ